jgi:hypothetical protein
MQDRGYDLPRLHLPRHSDEKCLRPYAEARSDLGDELVMPSHPIALSEFDTSLSPLVLAHRALDDLLILVVVVLELTRSMYLQVPIGPCARVAEGVVDPSGLHDQRAGRSDHDLPSDVERQLALQYEVALILAGVGVRRDHLARRHLRQGEREQLVLADPNGQVELPLADFQSGAATLTVTRPGHQPVVQQVKLPKSQEGGLSSNRLLVTILLLLGGLALGWAVLRRLLNN